MYSVENSICPIFFLKYRYYANWNKIINSFKLDTSVSGRKIYFSKFSFEEDTDLYFKLKNNVAGIPHIGFGNYEPSYTSKGGVNKNQNTGRITLMWGKNGGPYNSETLASSAVINENTICRIQYKHSTNEMYWYFNGTLVAYRTVDTEQQHLRLRIDVLNNYPYELEYLYVL